MPLLPLVWPDVDAVLAAAPLKLSNLVTLHNPFFGGDAAVQQDEALENTEMEAGLGNPDAPFIAPTPPTVRRAMDGQSVTYNPGGEVKDLYGMKKFHKFLYLKDARITCEQPAGAFCDECRQFKQDLEVFQKQLDQRRLANSQALQEVRKAKEGLGPVGLRGAAKKAYAAAENRLKENLKNGFPQKPGCYYRLPSGCPSNGLAAPIWTEDTEDKDGKAKHSEAACVARRGYWNDKCETDDAQTLYVMANPAYEPKRLDKVGYKLAEEEEQLTRAQMDLDAQKAAEDEGPCRDCFPLHVEAPNFRVAEKACNEKPWCKFFDWDKQRKEATLCAEAEEKAARNTDHVGGEHYDRVLHEGVPKEGTPGGFEILSNAHALCGPAQTDIFMRGPVPGVQSAEEAVEFCDNYPLCTHWTLATVGAEKSIQGEQPNDLFMCTGEIQGYDQSPGWITGVRMGEKAAAMKPPVLDMNPAKGPEGPVTFPAQPAGVSPTSWA